MHLNDRDVFVVGDVHGHFDRLEALLIKADLDRQECYVVQLGDLGHFGGSQGSPTGDYFCWLMAKDGWVDYVLWGNHDRAVVDRYHQFGGFEQPSLGVERIMDSMEMEGRLLFALDAHGWLLTHAGLHAQFKFQAAAISKRSVGEIADWLNRESEFSPVRIELGTRPEGEEKSIHAAVNAIGGRRGGWSPYGGILWRDIGEKLYGVPQVFGHSASLKHKVRGVTDEWWCVDIGGKGGKADTEANCLAGIWLPSQEVVRVDPEDLHYKPDFISHVKLDETMPSA